MSGPKRPWDCDTTMSKPSLERIMRALIVCKGHFTDAMVLGREVLTAGRTSSLFLRVWLPEGQVSRFEELAKPYTRLRPPPRIQVGLSESVCPEPGCDLRCPSGHHGGAEWRERVRS